MLGQGNRRLWLAGYFLAGSAAGACLIYTLARDFGSMASIDTIIRAAPVAVVTVFYFLVPLGAATQSWRLLFPQAEVPGFRSSARLTWIGLSVNWLLPVALVGGELVRFRLALRQVSRVENLVASLVGDKTIQVATQALYALLGLSVLAWAGKHVSGSAGDAAGFVLFCAVVYLFYRFQRTGMFSGLARRLGAFVRRREPIQIKAGLVDAAIDGMYQRGARWWGAVAWRLCFRVLLAAEVALVLWWLGNSLVVLHILALESIAQASRVAAMLIPAALGAQETAIMAAGLILGYPAESLIAVAVVKRVRELVVGGAGLVIWQTHEVRALLGNRS
ncbi:MAG: lysylphosphatidylglycerol synthase domain-containing protein [Arenicellales bacterium]